jgi:hypothetical protein
VQEQDFYNRAVDRRDNLDLKPTRYRIALFGVTVDEVTSYLERDLAMNPNQCRILGGTGVAIVKTMTSSSPHCGRLWAGQLPSKSMAWQERCGLALSTRHWNSYCIIPMQASDGGAGIEPVLGERIHSSLMEASQAWE